MKFKNDIEAEAIIEVQSGLKDKDNLLGSAGQLLSSTGSQVSWVDASGLSAKTAEAVVQPMKANEALSKGDPLYIVGFQAGQDVNIVAKADASNSAKMPVVGVSDDDYSSQDFGTMTAFGSFNGAFDTTGGTENWSVGDIIYVKPGGGLTNVKPTGTNLIQNIAIVSRVQQNTGELEVIALGRTNDVPNLPAGRLFVGTATNTSLSSNVVYIDEANNRVGIGTSSPSANLEIASTGTGDAILVTNNDATSTAAPVLTLKRDSASPADGDYLGQIKFKGENDASQEIVYAKITAKTSDVTDTTEDGLIETAVKSGGSNLIVSRQTGTDLKLINGVGIEVDGDATFSSGNITLGGTGRIQGIDTVSATTDAANKAYVDANVGATDLNGLTDCLVDTESLYVGEVPSGLIGNPQNNTTLGIDAGDSLTSGVKNTCIGSDAGTSLTTANENTAVGYRALQNQNTIGNTALGVLSGGAGSGGDYSVYVGYKSGQNNGVSGHVSIGTEAGYSNTSGDRNTNVGYKAGYQNTTNSYRTYLGYEAGNYNSGSGNTGIGYRACNGYFSFGAGQGTGANNTAVGYEALSSLNGTGAANNTAIGRNALGGVITGGNNTALGFSTGSTITSGSNLTVLGYGAEPSSATSTNEITLGNASVTSLRIPGLQSSASDGDVLTYSSSTGKITLAAAGGGGATDLNGLSDCLVDTASLYVGEVPSGLSGNPQSNTVLGIDAGVSLTTGDSNTLIGNNAGDSITGGTNSVAIGFDALASTTTGGSNVAVGTRAYKNGRANSNVYIGNSAGENANSGVWQIGIGDSAGFNNTGGSSIGIGWFANRNNSATGTISIGHQAGYSNTSGAFNTNIGYKAGYSNTTNQNRTIIGYEAGYFSTGSYNTFLGYRVGYGSSGNTTGERNVAIGDIALTALQGGYRNVAIGTNCGQGVTSGNQNVMIGDFAGSSLTTGADNVIIGQNAQSSSATVSNEITLGASNITSFRIPGIQSGASDGDVLTYNASAGKLELQAAGGGGIDGSGTASYIPKWSDSDTLTDSGIYDSGTNIGIGTATPSARLQVIGTSTPAKFYYNSSFTNAQYTAVNIGMMTSGTIADGFGPKLTFRTGGNGFDGYAAADIGTKRNGADSTHDLTFATSTGGSMTDKMIIKNNGYVGIGTTSPSAKLSIEGTTGTSSSNLLTIKSNTSFPFSSIHIVDFINSSGSTVGKILMNTSSVTYSTTSDYRLKENIDEISNSINRVKQLKPKRFNFIGEADRTVDGFLAHEVAEVVPHAVDGEKDAIDSKGKPIYQGIDQSAIVPLLTAALQEAIAKIEDLETRIQELENK